MKSYKNSGLQFSFYINYILDLQGMDLRIEHSHGFSKHGDGGHYHYDTTPEEVEYLGYFVLGESEFRRRMMII